MSKFCTFSKWGTLWKFTKIRGFEQLKDGKRPSGETQGKRPSQEKQGTGQTEEKEEEAEKEERREQDKSFYGSHPLFLDRNGMTSGT